jgi:integrase
VPRKRKPENADLPPHLYESCGYFTWRHPKTREPFSLGRDRAYAIREARAANAHLAAAQSLPARIAAAETPADRSVAAFLPAYRAHLDTADLAQRTRYGRKRHLHAIEKALGDVAIGPRTEDGAEVTRRTALFLDEYVKAGKRRMARALRSTLVDLYGVMAAAGWITVNPAELVRLPSAKVKRARLSLEQFRAIYEAAAKLDPWVQNALALALVTLQRREDVSRMTFRAIVDGRLRVEQQKTGARLRIPLELRLGCVGWSLGEVVARCRDNIVSPRLVHHTRHQGRAKPGAAVHPQTFATAFAEARTAAGIAVEEGLTLPSFHELRSLGARLYKQQGYDPQALLGHKDAATTALYLDDRGAAWIDVRVGNG